MLFDIFVFLAAALAAVSLSKALGFSSVLGYLAAGAIVGPNGFGFVGRVEDSLAFGEIGIVLLLFIVGLELNPRRLKRLRTSVFGLGAAQLLITATVAALLLAGATELAAAPVIVLAFALALSSTAFVLPLLAERRELATKHGRAAFGVLLLQDISVVPALVVLAAFGVRTAKESSTAELLLAVALVAAGFWIARHLLRPTLRFVAKLGVHELFTALSLALVIGAALAVEHAGLTMGLGALLAGMVVADSEYRHALESDLDPFKGLLLGLFFMAVGMALEPALLRDDTVRVVGAVLALVTVKATVMLGVALAFKFDARDAVRVALIVSQGGEFAFVLLAEATSGGLIDHGVAEMTVLVVTLSMITTPLLLKAVDALGGTIPTPRAHEPPERPEHVVIAGFGRFGRIVARVLTMRDIPFTALDTSTEQIEASRLVGHQIYYGDPSRLELLRSIGLEHARAIVVAVEDMPTSLKIVELLNAHFPSVEIYARARDREHLFALRDLGVVHIMRDTLLSSMEMARMLLEGLGDAPERARASIDTFLRHEREALERQYLVHHDDAAYVRSRREAEDVLRRHKDA
jgi:monovalent cation:proton antiporter-2 (CPA2) family protein